MSKEGRLTTQSMEAVRTETMTMEMASGVMNFNK